MTDKKAEEDYFTDHVLKNRMKALDNCNEFQRIFGIRLKPYWDGNILGFDVIKFDEWLEVPEDISTMEHIKVKFGQDGCDIINKLLA